MAFAMMPDAIPQHDEIVSAFHEATDNRQSLVDVSAILRREIVAFLLDLNATLTIGQVLAVLEPLS